MCKYHVITTSIHKKKGCTRLFSRRRAVQRRRAAWRHEDGAGGGGGLLRCELDPLKLRFSWDFQ